jgi:two-component system chemotaxis response regulator CheY
MKILAIDDTHTLRALLCQCLRGAGHEVVEAENGVEGLAQFATHAPAMVITDLNMPEMDGIQFTRACREQPEGATTPIVILTTETGQDLRAEGRRAGATAWMVKPFVPETLLALVAQFDR